MKYLKLFKNFDKYKMLIKYKIRNYTINSDESIDVDGDVYLFNKGLTELPLKFNKVNGIFDCDDNKLTSLEGCPQTIGGSFLCSYNKLTSLEGCPEIIEGSFFCSNNNLTSFDGCPKSVRGDFKCYNNKIFTFDGLPDFMHVSGRFDCWGNLVYNVWGLFRDVYKFEIFNFCDPIRPPKEEVGTPIIILDRLNEFLSLGGYKNRVEKVKGYINI